MDLQNKLPVNPRYKTLHRPLCSVEKMYHRRQSPSLWWVYMFSLLHPFFPIYFQLVAPWMLSGLERVYFFCIVVQTFWESSPTEWLQLSLNEIYIVPDLFMAREWKVAVTWGTSSKKKRGKKKKERKGRISKEWII